MERPTRWNPLTTLLQAPGQTVFWGEGREGGWREGREAGGKGGNGEQMVWERRENGSVSEVFDSEIYTPSNSQWRSDDHGLK